MTNRDRKTSSTQIPTPALPAKRVHWGVRAALWALLSLVLVSGASSSQISLFSDPFAAEIAASSPSGPGPAPAGPVYAPAGEYAAPVDQGSAYQPLVDANTGEGGEEMDLVPAWRWRDNTGFHDNYDWNEFAETGTTAIAEVLFGVSGFIWLLILGTLRFGLNLDILSRLGEAGSGLSDVFARLSDTIVGSGLALLALVAAVITMVRLSLRGNLVRGVSTVIATVLPLAALVAFSAAAQSDASRDNSGSAVVGSPVYLAQKGLSIADRMAGSVGTYVGDIAGFNSEQSAYAELSPSCGDYTESLRRAYRYSRSLSDDPSTSTEAILTVSSLWERAFLSNWIIAQYDGAQGGWRIWCHHLEANANTPRSEQVMIGNLAGYPTISTEDRKNPFVIQINGGKGQRAAMWIWAACVHNGSTWQAQAAWYVTGEVEGPDCALWWEGGSSDENQAPTKVDGKKLLQWDEKPSADNSELDGASGSGVLSYQSGLHDDTDEVRKLINGTVGDNSGTRLMAGLITLVTAIVFLYVLGAISIGTVVAKIGFVVMLVLLPGTLFLLALPTGGRGRNPAGVKMLKMTGSYLAANFVLTGVLILLLAVINVLTTLVVSSVPLGGTSGLLTMVVPLASLFVLRKALKSIGMGDITSAKGALGLATSAGLAGSEGRNSVRSAQNRQARLNDPNRKDNLMNRMGKRLDRFDKAAKAPKDWGKNRAALAGRNLRNKSKQGLDAAANKLTGHTVADWGNRLSDGTGSLASKLTTAAGLGSILDATVGRLPFIPDAAFGYIGEKITSFNPAAMDQYRQTQLEAEQRREMWEVTRGLGNDPVARQEAFRTYIDSKRTTLAATQQHETLAGGATFPDGTKVMAFIGKDNEGKEFVLTPEAAGWNAATGTANDGVEIRTDPIEHFITPQLKDLQAVAAQRFGVDASQIGIGTSGTGPVFLPSSGAKSPPPGLSPEHAMLAANAGTFFIPDDVRARVRHLDASAQADFYQSYAMASGMLDPVTGAAGALAKLGFDASDPRTQLMVEAWARGEETALSGAAIELPAATVTSLIAAADAGFQARARRDSGFAASSELRKVIDKKALSVDSNKKFLTEVARDLDQVQTLSVRVEEITSVATPQLTRAAADASSAYATSERELVLRRQALAATGTDPATDAEARRLADEVAARMREAQQAQAALDQLAAERAQAEATIAQTMTRLSQEKMQEQILDAHSSIAMIPDLVKMDKELRAGRVYDSIKNMEVAAQAAAGGPPILETISTTLASGGTPAEQAAALASFLREQVIPDAVAKVETSHMMYAKHTRNRFTSAAYVTGMLPGS